MGLNAFVLIIFALICVLYAFCLVARVLGMAKPERSKGYASADYMEIYRAVEPREI